jgi:hypothetical protein
MTSCQEAILVESEETVCAVEWLHKHIPAAAKTLRPHRKYCIHTVLLLLLVYSLLRELVYGAIGYFTCTEKIKGGL